MQPRLPNLPPAPCPLPNFSHRLTWHAALHRPGISTETGNAVWDPLKLADKMDEGNLNLVRAAELKHGRVAMLAIVGWVWTATGTHFEGLISSSSGITFADLAAQPNPIAAAAMVSPTRLFPRRLRVPLSRVARREGQWEGAVEMCAAPRCAVLSCPTLSRLMGQHLYRL